MKQLERIGWIIIIQLLCIIYLLGSLLERTQ